jgi:hypothetical protein
LGEEGYRTIIIACTQLLQGLLKEIKAAMLADNLSGVAKICHRLKGVAGNYGLLSLYRQACGLEEVAGLITNGLSNLISANKLITRLSVLGCGFISDDFCGRLSFICCT